MRSTCQIIVMSDFHVGFKRDERNEDSSIYLSSIEKYFETIVDDLCGYMTGKSDQDVYLILNGDIAIKGAKSDYVLFEDVFLKRLKTNTLFRRLKVVSVPGNHDIELTKERLDLFKPDIDSKERTFEQRQSMFKDKYSALKDCFKEYRDFVKRNDINVLDENLVKDELYGYCVDHENKLLFILLNSAWFSLGSKINELIAETIIEENLRFAEDQSNRSVKELIESSLKMKDALFEYGNQQIGSPKLGEIDWNNIFGKCNGYTTFLLSHHPINWWSYFEVNVKRRSEEEKLLINNILKQTNFLLTGHEHLGSRERYDTIKYGVYHLKNGCIMDFNESSFNKPFNRENVFSILELSRRKEKCLREKRYGYSLFWKQCDVGTFEVIRDETNSVLEYNFSNKLFLHNSNLGDASDLELIERTGLVNNSTVGKGEISDFLPHLKLVEATLRFKDEQKYFFKVLRCSEQDFESSCTMLFEEIVNNKFLANDGSLIVNFIVFDSILCPDIYEQINYNLDSVGLQYSEMNKRKIDEIDRCFFNFSRRINQRFDLVKYKFFEENSHLINTKLSLGVLCYSIDYEMYMN